MHNLEEQVQTQQQNIKRLLWPQVNHQHIHRAAPKSIRILDVFKALR